MVINLQLLFVRITEVFVPEHKSYNLELEPYSVRNFKIALAIFIINYILYLKLHLGEAIYGMIVLISLRLCDSDHIT